MTGLYLLELRLDPSALMRFCRDRGLGASGREDDFGYGVHAWLRGAFGSEAPQPWRLFLDPHSGLRILGYGRYDADALRQRLAEGAVYSSTEVSILSKPMPAWQRGRRLRFELQGCPVGRTSRIGIEKDLFLMQGGGGGAEHLSREAVYCTWAIEHLQRADACAVGGVRMTGFRLARQHRRPIDSGGRRSSAYLVRPQAILQGELTVGDPAAFAGLLSSGIGRHKAFGYGMLLLRPAQ